jgi:hypothetical protein
MRSSRAILYAQRLSELTSQLSELEDIRGLVDEAERRARGAPPLRLTRPASRRLRSREPAALSVRLRRHAPPSRNAGAISPLTTTTKSIGLRWSHSPTDGGLPPKASRSAGVSPGAFPRHEQARSQSSADDGST